MWVLYAFGSALFAGLTAILAKCGIRKTDSTVATAIRTIVVLAFSWGMVFLVGSEAQLAEISGRTLLFLVLSGLATGASWLCYFRALQIGDVNKVVPVDKSSTVLTILLAALFLHETLSWTRGIGMVCIAAGTYLMIEKKQSSGTARAGGSWLLYAAGSCVRKPDVDPWQDRHYGCGVQPRDGHSDGRSPDHVVDDGVRHGKGRAGAQDPEK